MSKNENFKNCIFYLNAQKILFNHPLLLQLRLSEPLTHESSQISFNSSFGYTARHYLLLIVECVEKRSKVFVKIVEICR